MEERLPYNLLPFKLEITEKEITPRSGLAVYAEALMALKVKELVQAHLPKPGSNRGYSPWRFIQPLMMMLYGGGRHLEDLRELRQDKVIRKLIEMHQMPASSTVGDWLVRMGEGEGIEGMERVNREVVKRVLSKEDKDHYTLDVDATIIEAEKREAQWTYKKLKGS